MNIIAIDPSSARTAIVTEIGKYEKYYTFEPTKKNPKITSTKHRDNVRVELISWLANNFKQGMMTDKIIIERTSSVISSSQVGMREMLIGVLETYFRQFTNIIILMPNGPKSGWFVENYGLEYKGRQARKTKIMEEFPDSPNDDIADCKGMIKNYKDKLSV